MKVVTGPCGMGHIVRTLADVVPGTVFRYGGGGSVYLRMVHGILNFQTNEITAYTNPGCPPSTLLLPGYIPLPNAALYTGE